MIHVNPYTTSNRFGEMRDRYVEFFYRGPRVGTSVEFRGVSANDDSDHDGFLFLYSFVELVSLYRRGVDREPCFLL